MTHAIVIRGRYVGQEFVPNEPMPVAEGTAELIVFPNGGETPPAAGGSIFDLFGKAKQLRSGEDIDAQIGEERESWGEP
jgi:hypothetical protein